MNTQVPFLVAVLLIHSVCGSYSGQYANQAYSYKGYSGDYGHDDLRYHGPTAIPHVLHDGHIADTHEVAAAKAEHYKAVATAKSHSGYGHGGSYGYGGNYGYDSSYGGAYHTTPYHGPLAKPVVLKSGYLADTHEVSAAKAAHHTTVVSAKAHSGYGSEGSYGFGGNYNHSRNYGYEGSYGYGSSYGHGSSANYHTAPYYGPLAKPVVLKSGYLADTHEVSTAKAAHHTAAVAAKAHSGYGSEGSYIFVENNQHRGNYGHEGSYGYGESNGFGNGGSTRGYGHGSSANYHTAPYHGPLAKPGMLKSGYLANTH